MEKNGARLLIQDALNKPLKFVTATKSVAFTSTRFARLLTGRYIFMRE